MDTTPIRGARTGKRFRQRINMIDKFYMAIHEISHTMIYLADFHVEGALSFETFREACVATYTRLPVLKSVVRGREGWFGRLWWEELDTDGAELVELVDLYRDGQHAPEEVEALYREVYAAHSNTTWDIRREPPMKCKLVRLGEERWCLFFLIHHSVADGHGTKAILQVFAENYTLLASGQRPPQDPIPQARRSYLKFVLRTPPWKLLATLYHYVTYERMNRPRATTPFLLEWPRKEGVIRKADIVLRGEVVRQLLERVRALGISLNEAMLVACARNLFRWLRAQGRNVGKVSIAVPVNMRSYMNLKATESVANCSVTMNINLRASLMENASKLIEAIRFQSRGLKRLRFPIIGIVQTALMSWLPLRLLKRMIARSIETGMAARNTATLVYSNVGMVFVDAQGKPFLIPVGPRAVVRSLEFSNPIAYPVAASMATITYGGDILVSLSYLEPVLERSEMEAFLAGFREELFAVMDEETLMDTPLPPFASCLDDAHAGHDDRTGT